LNVFKRLNTQIKNGFSAMFPGKVAVYRGFWGKGQTSLNKGGNTKGGRLQGAAKWNMWFDFTKSPVNVDVSRPNNVETKPNFLKGNRERWPFMGFSSVFCSLLQAVSKWKTAVTICK